MTKAKIKDMLVNYKRIKTATEFALVVGETSISNETVRDFERLNRCITLLDDESRAIMIKTYYEGKSLRRCARELNYSHNTIDRKKDKALDLITECFSVLEK